MQLVELVQAESGARKVSCTKALQAHCGLGLDEAKNVTDALLDKQYPTVSLESVAAARRLIIELAALGVVARFAEGPGYNPQERLASVLASVQTALTPEVYQACQAMSAHGEWELALSHGMSNLRSSDLQCKVDFTSLSELAVEFGILQRIHP